MMVNNNFNTESDPSKNKGGNGQHHPSFPDDSATDRFPNLNLWPYLSVKSQHAIIRSVTFGTWLCSHPHYYDKTTRRFYLAGGRRHLVFRIGVVVVFAVLIFAILRYFLCRSLMDIETSVASQFIIALLASPCGSEINYLVISNEYSELANQGIGFFKAFAPYAIKNYQAGGQRMDKNLWKMDALAKIAIGSYLSGATCAALAFSFFAYKGPLFLPSLVDPSWVVGYTVMRVLHALLMFFVMYCFITPSIWHMLQYLHFTFPILTALKHMINAQGGRNGEAILADIKWYNQMRLLVNLMSEGLCHVLLPYAQVILLIFSSYGIYALIRLKGLVRASVFSVGLNAIISLLLLFRYFGEYDARSQAILELWRKKSKDAYTKRLVRSLRPLRIRNADNFVDIPIVLTTMDVIVNNTITLLYL